MKMILSGLLVVLGLLACSSKAQNLDCVLIVPPNALTAQGLATPWQLAASDPTMGPCNMNNTNQQALVEGIIIDLDTGALSVYSPLVVDSGTQPAVAPVVPVLPTNFAIGLWIGFNGDTLELVSSPNTTSADDAGCVSGIIIKDSNVNQTDLFGQFVFCNASNFYTQATILINAGKIIVPPIGLGFDGFPCPTIRDFGILDDDPSDTVTTTYLLTSNGTLAQATAANWALFPDAQEVNNGRGVEALVVITLGNALGCVRWQVPNLADNGTLAGACALDELAIIYGQSQPVGFIPANDHMVISSVTGQPSLDKLNAFRQGVGQVPVTSLDNASTTTYCQALSTIAPARLQSWAKFDVDVPPLDPDMGSTFMGYMAARFLDAWAALNCTMLTNLSSPIEKVVDEKGNTVGGFIAVQNNTIPSSAFNQGGLFFAPPRNVTL